MRQFRMLVLMVILACFLAGCAAHIHTVGTGASGGNVTKERQWYVLWGLVPINKVETDQIAGSATNYTIKTEQSFLDVVINIVTGIVTVNSRTVTVTK